MNEWLMIGYMATSAVLFSVGGTGPKWVRRYLLPGVAVLFLIAFGVIWWKAVAVGLLRIGAYSLGYGQSKSYLEKFAVFTLYAIPSLLLGWTYWIVWTPVLLTIGFYLSNQPGTGKDVQWKVWEFGAGTLIAFTDIGAIMR